MASIAANTSAKLSRLPQKASRDSFILTLKKVQLTIMDILRSLRANDSNKILSQVTAVPEADIDAKEMTRLLPCLVNGLTQSRDRSAQINILGAVRECIEQYLAGAVEVYDHKEHFDANLCHSHWGCMYILYSVWNTDPLLYYWAWAWDTIQSAAFQIYAPWSYVNAYTINWQILQDFQENPVANVSAPQIYLLLSLRIFRKSSAVITWLLSIDNGEDHFALANKTQSPADFPVQTYDLITCHKINALHKTTFGFAMRVSYRLPVWQRESDCCSKYLFTTARTTKKCALVI